MMSELQRARAKGFTAACIVEVVAVELGQTTHDDAVERLCQQFFPALVGVDLQRESAATPGSDN